MTHRQRQVAELLAVGTDRAQIAAAMNIKPATVKKHLQRARHRVRKGPTAPRMRRTRIRPFSLLQTENI